MTHSPSQALTFCTISACSVRQWAAHDGALVSEFTDVSTHELSVIAIDSSERRLFVGDTAGAIHAINYATGVTVRDARAAAPSPRAS